jgi:hypothetical protein
VRTGSNPYRPRRWQGVSWWFSLVLVIPLLGVLGTLAYHRVDFGSDTNGTAVEVVDQTPEVAATAEDPAAGSNDPAETDGEQDDQDDAEATPTGGDTPVLVSLEPAPIAGSHFGHTWARTDFAVAAGAANRTWMWGPEAVTPPLREPYAESPGGTRLVQYFDKTRMEITDPSGDPSEPWFVTNGLLAKELVTGELQLGEESFEQYQPAEVNVVGDADDELAPTYASFSGLLDPQGHEPGDVVAEQIMRDGEVVSNPTYGDSYGVTIAMIAAETGHGVATPFWEFMTSRGLTWQDGEYRHADLFDHPYYATGLPITEPYWTTVEVAGVSTDVLIQVFERRVMTYTPANSSGWRVEAGNVGQHYFQWRYGNLGYALEEADDAPQAWTPPPPPAAMPVPFSECYEPRPSDDEHDLVLLPAEPGSLFQQCQIVAYYGFPTESRMGIVGEYPPEEMIALLKEQAAEFEQYNGFRTAIPALELIYAVAQGSQTADGTFLARMPASMVERWIEIAEEHDLLIIFDIQMGSSTVEAEIPHLLPYLTHPRVHLALDPEFVTTPDQPPGLRIGGMDAAEINRAQHMLKELVDEHNLPNKILMIHQFVPHMITNKDQLENVPGIDLVIHQDGFGTDEAKIANYNRYVAAEGAKHGGFKVFYRQDDPVMTPAELMQLTPQPDVITYQ